LGSGTILCGGGNVNIKTLKAGLGLSISNTTNDVTYKTNFVNGTGISITGTTSQTFTNTGVTSLTSGDTNSLTFDVSTGAVTATPILKKLCEAVATGGETTLTCTLSASQQYLWIRGGISYNADTSTVIRMRFNGDGGNNYSYRNELNGAADSTTLSTSGFSIVGATASQINYIHFSCTDFISSQEKFCTGFRTFSVSGAGSAPAKSVWAAKWANTANDITSVSFERSAGTGTFEANNFLAVWGYQ
jgi:hypothetical protein